MRWFTLITVLGVLGIPFVGYSMDVLGFRATRAITIALGCLWSGLTLVPVEAVLLPSFAVYALFRTFTFNYYFAYLADRLGVLHHNSARACVPPPLLLLLAP